MDGPGWPPDKLGRVPFVEGASSLFVAEMGDHCTHYPEHNLVRCPTQLALVKSIETQETALRKFVDTL